MKLEHPLLQIVLACESICVKDCCGIGAYDFSPINIAAGLIKYACKPVEADVALLKIQFESLKNNFGSQSAAAKGVTIEDMNHNFTSSQVDYFVQELLHNIDVAMELIASTNLRKFRRDNE